MPQRAAVAAAAVIAAALLAGCAQATVEPALEGPPAAPGWPAYDVAGEHPFAADTVAGVPGADPVLGGPGVFVEVPDRAERLTVRADWTCSSPTCGFRLELSGPGGALAEAVGQGSAEVAQDRPASGHWEARLSPDVAAAGLQGSFNVTVRMAGTP